MALAAADCTTVGTVSTPGATDAAIHKIRHVVIIMQENRSFDSYFGTFPGADGIPMNLGVPSVCAPDPATGWCNRPYHDPNDRNYGGPHAVAAAVTTSTGGGWTASWSRCDGPADAPLTPTTRRAPSRSTRT
jgi:phospholipase C